MLNQSEVEMPEIFSTYASAHLADIELKENQGLLDDVRGTVEDKGECLMNMSVSVHAHDIRCFKEKGLMAELLGNKVLRTEAMNVSEGVIVPISEGDAKQYSCKDIFKKAVLGISSTTAGISGSIVFGAMASGVGVGQYGAGTISFIESAIALSCVGIFAAIVGGAKLLDVVKMKSENRKIEGYRHGIFIPVDSLNGKVFKDVWDKKRFVYFKSFSFSLD